jgi:acyl-homoserine lactone synthase
MTAVNFVNVPNRPLYENEFDEFLRRRHDFSVWQRPPHPASADGRELDQFNPDAAIYLLGIEADLVVTSARLIPTTEPHMVSEVLPHMCLRRAIWTLLLSGRCPTIHQTSYANFNM